MAQTKTVDANEFFTSDIADYLNNLKIYKPDVGDPMILKANVDQNKALGKVADAVSGKVSDETRFDKKLIKLIAKSGAKPTVKKVYQSVLATLFKTHSVEYDYSYLLLRNGDTINMSARKIAINEGYAEFTAACQCFTGDIGASDGASYPWADVTDDMLTDVAEPDYLFAKVTQSDVDKESKESMRQYNAKLRQWLIDFQQEKEGKARSVTNVNIYDKDYDYDEGVFLAPYILVSYDLGKSIVTFPVNAVTGLIDGALLNNPAARFDHDASIRPPSFSVPVLIVASLAMVVLGGILYTVYYLTQSASYKSKSLNGYNLSELRKLL